MAVLLRRRGPGPCMERMLRMLRRWFLSREKTALVRVESYWKVPGRGGQCFSNVSISQVSF